MIKRIKYYKPYRYVIRCINSHFPVLMAKLRFRKKFGRELNLKDPRDLNEKILWLSLFSDTTEWSRLADKYAVRQYVEEKGLGEILITLYDKWDKIDDIDWDVLPDSFALKSNNGSGTVLLVNDKSKLNITETKCLLSSWLTRFLKTETTEFHYQRIQACIIAEELLVQSEKEKFISETLIDYKIWCFNGEAYAIWTCSNRIGGSTEVALFDKYWNYHPELSIFNEHYKECKVLPLKPEKLDYMLKVAECLSEGFPQVRVDLYYNNNKVYFGELTFTCYGGSMDFYTQDFLIEMGNKVDLSGVKRK